MPRIDESELELANEPAFVARQVQVKRNQDPRRHYGFSDELGRGRFGTVLRCTEKATGLALAAKFVSTKQREERENVEREVDIMRSLQHRRLLQLYDVYDDGNSEMCIITELISGGELFERVIDDDFELTEKVCAIFMRQICEGVDYMHGQLVMHLDMKPENILCVSRTGNRIKLIDFGLARRYEPSKSLQVMFGTPDFAAPEVLGYDRVTPAADMWSVGVICYVLLSGLSPFMGNSDLETMTNVTRAVYDFDDEAFEPISGDAKHFIGQLLVREPQKRPTPAACLQHKWLCHRKSPPGAKGRGKEAALSKTKLKKYVVRRRWQKAVTAIMALSRMGANLSLVSGALPAGRRTAPPATSSSSSTSTKCSQRTSSSSSSTFSGSTGRPPVAGAGSGVSRFSATSSSSSKCSSAQPGAPLAPALASLSLGPAAARSRSPAAPATPTPAAKPRTTTSSTTTSSSSSSSSTSYTRLTSGARRH